MATLRELREKFDKALSHVDRDGMKDLINWLDEETDFFTAPASTRFHGNFEGGLLHHSLNVLEFALTNFNWILKHKPELEHLKESIIISALLHDVCKTNMYVSGKKWTKDKNNRWVEYMGYSVDDKLPLPHGSKSVYLLSKFIKLTDLEALAITYHMGMSEPNTMIDGLNKYAYQSASENILVKIIMAADMLSVTLEDTIDYKANAK